MHQDLTKARQLLHTGKYTCVLCRGQSTLTSTARGVRPLVEFLHRGTLEGYSAADKVVGKATAFLYVLLGVCAVYTPVVSKPAFEVLRSHNIEIICDSIVPAIFNRDRSGFCPMESAVQHIHDPIQAKAAIENAMVNGIHRK